MLVTIANIINRRTQEIVHKLRSFKDGRPIAWRKFCYDVHVGAVDQVDSLVHRKSFRYLSEVMDDVYTVDLESQRHLDITT
jgi:hypothetical protein